MPKVYGSFIPYRMKSSIESARDNDTFVLPWTQIMSRIAEDQTRAEIRERFKHKVWPEMMLLAKEAPRTELFSEYLTPEQIIEFFNAIMTDPEQPAFQKWHEKHVQDGDTSELQNLRNKYNERAAAVDLKRITIAKEVALSALNFLTSQARYIIPERYLEDYTRPFLDIESRMSGIYFEAKEKEEKKAKAS
jgi:hypothetical protein